MKKYLAMLMAALMVFALAGCGGKEEAGTLSLENFEAVDGFITDIYGEFGEEELPMMLMQTELPLDDMDMLSYNTGLTSTEGVAAAIVSESATGSIAYSLIYIVGTEEADAAALLDDVMAGVDPRKWICVGAEKLAGFTMGNDVFFVMGGTDLVDNIVEKAEAKAEELGFATGALKEAVGE